MTDEQWTPERAMVIVAHPDDAEFGSAGTVARWADEGVAVAYVVVTDGSKGTSDRQLDGDALSSLRADEQRAAAAVLGVEKVVFLDLPDGEIVPDLQLRHMLAREIRRWRPDIVVTHDPSSFYWDNYINHPDHRAVGQAALEAVFPTARDHLNAPHLLEEGLDPHIVREVYLAGSQQTDHWVDIEPTFERKLAALRKHASQIDDPDQLAKWVRERAAERAEGHGMALAEGFKRIKLG